MLEEASPDFDQTEKFVRRKIVCKNPDAMRILHIC